MDSPNDRRWVEHVMRVCLVVDALGIIAYQLQWVDPQEPWARWMVALPGIAVPLLLVPWWWAPERRSADTILMMTYALVPSAIVAVVGQLVPAIIGLIILIALLLLAPRIVPPSYQLAGVPAGRISYFALRRERRRILAASRSGRPSKRRPAGR